MKKKLPAFTLLEMSIVLFIISLLILIMLPNLAAQRKHATGTHRQAMVAVVQTQIDLYKNDTGETTVDFGRLERNDYLTPAQVVKARRQKIVIVNGKAMAR